MLSLSRDEAAEIERRAAVAGLPAVLWATLAVEATRSTTLVVSVFSLPDVVVGEVLSTAAAEALAAKRQSRLSEYANALRAAVPRPQAGVAGGFALRPGLVSATAWEAEAERTGLTPNAWALRAIAESPEGFVAWEAAAADEGRSLPEWALVQAARRRRSASTPAQITG